MDEIEKRIRQRLKDDFPHYANKCLKIRTKSGDIKPFTLNQAQLHIHQIVEQQKRELGRVRVIIVKGRQQGCSTYIEGRFYWLTTHRFGMRAFIITHDFDATNNLFEMAQRYHQHCPIVVRPQTDTSNAKELIFGKLESGYRVGTAGNKTTGRSSTIQYLHASEVAYWSNASEHAKGILQAVPMENGTEIFLESTAQGVGNYFHEQWQIAESGQSDFIPIFIPWYWQPEYMRSVDSSFTLQDDEEDIKRIYMLSDEQVAWRRYKIMELSAKGVDGNKAFQQEYPFTSVEAFQNTGEDNFILPHIVMLARKCVAEGYGGLVIGVDPARFGDDRTSIIRRRGRVAYGLESYAKKDTMEVSGIVHTIIVKEKPEKVFIDVGGLGAGVYDRLRELGHDGVIVAVNGGNTPLDQNKYINKRAEMWGEMREWLVDQPAVIPDSDSLHADLCGIKYKYDSKSRLVMEKKEEMKKRGVRSPDEGDALALTFAKPEQAITKSMDRRYDDIARDMMRDQTRINYLRKKAYARNR